MRCSRDMRGAGGAGRPARRRAARGCRAACASPQISSTGGSQPVTLDAPVSASRAGVGPSSSTGRRRRRRRCRQGCTRPSATIATRRPGQQIGVVLDHGGDHDVVGAEPEPVGEMVDGLGGVAHEHDDVVGTLRAPGEAVHAGPGRPRRPRWRGATCSPPLGARSSTTGGTRTRSATTSSAGVDAAQSRSR